MPYGTGPLGDINTIYLPTKRVGLLFRPSRLTRPSAGISDV